MTQPESKWQRFVAGFRIVTTRGVVAALVVLVILCDTQWPRGSLVETICELGSVVLVAIGLFGRLWCTLFISGYKTKNLITAGPYSIVRNPLYVFSFIGALGIAMVTAMLSLVALVFLLFAFYYPTVVLLEERKLREIHGEAYEQYCQRVPSFWPKFSLYQEPEYYEFNTRLFRKAALDGMWFILAYPVLGIIRHLHEINWLPALHKLF